MQTIASALRCIGVVWAIVNFGAPLTFSPSNSNLFSHHLPSILKGNWNVWAASVLLVLYQPEQLDESDRRKFAGTVCPILREWTLPTVVSVKQFQSKSTERKVGCVLLEVQVVQYTNAYDTRTGLCCIYSAERLVHVSLTG